MFKRPIAHILEKRLNEPRQFIQALIGPRQTGKTTIVQQVMADLKMPSHYASADEPVLKDTTWIEQQWENARFKAKTDTGNKKTLLVLDEIQKIPAWSEIVKRLWDEDSAKGQCLHAVILGSSPLLVQDGLTESLAGRFEIIPVTHWSFSEMQQAFGWEVEHYIFYGGYPGAADIMKEPQRWRRYIIDSLIETTVSRDILLMTRVDKPALLWRLFELGCLYSGQVLSYQKMLGQLQDAGNTTTLAHYLQLLEGAGLVKGLTKYSGEKARQRASSPKLQVFNTALMTALSTDTFEKAKQNPEYWGRLVESAVGATLINELRQGDAQVYYWTRGNWEVDFVLCRGEMLVAIEVKSSRKKTRLPGIDAFSKQFKVKRKLLVGAQGIPLDEFLSLPPSELLS